MNDTLKQTALAAANFWQGIVSCAEDLDAGGHILVLARETGWSEKSISKRMNAAAYFLNRGMTFQQVVDMGPEKCVSEWQVACNLNQGKQPGATANISHRVRREVRDNWAEMLKAVTGATGASVEDSLNAIAETFINSEPAEILHVLGRYLGVRE